MRTHVYIDGFNLFYGCLKGGPCKWLDVAALADALLPPNDVRAVKYFTARVEDRQNDPRQAQRQDAYLRAIDTLPRVEIIYGQFLTHPRWRRRADGNGRVRVWHTEEKGSDVNLASHLIHDAHCGLYECAVVVSNDSDLAEPIRLVRNDLELPVGILFPTLRGRRRPTRELARIASFRKEIRAGVLGDCQLPNPLAGTDGPIHKPSTW